MNLEFIPFKEEHAEELVKFAIDPEAKLNRKQARSLVDYGVGYTGTFKDRLICAFGAICNKNGAGDVWFIMTEAAWKIKKTVLRDVRTMLNTHMATSDLKRLRSPSRKGFPESQRLLEFLGFKRQRRDMINGGYYFYLRGA